MDKYAFLMVDFKMPDFIKRLQDSIPESELYLPEEPDSPFVYGLETETHTTIAPCLDNDVDLDGIKNMLMPLDSYVVMLTNISSFQNEKYDVLKCDVNCDALYETNSGIASAYELHTEFKEYHPHVTVAYLKPGRAEKYLKRVLPEPVFLKPVCFSFGYVGADGKYENIRWN